MKEIIYKVYVKLNNNKVITQVESNLRQDIDFSSGWILIDEGSGDKYAHAQNYYFLKALRDTKGRFNYRYTDDKVTELTEEEKESLFPVQTPQLTEIEFLRQQLLETQAQIVDLQEQILLNNGGAK